MIDPQPGTKMDHDGPLRKVVEVLRPHDQARLNPALLKLECGHEVEGWGSEWRCRLCAKRDKGGRE